MNVLWIKCTSHGRGYLYKLEEYITKNRKVKLIGNLDEDVPHNTMPFVLNKQDVYYKDTKIDLKSIHQAVFIFCPENEVITPEFKEYLIKFENILLTYNILITNQPSKIIKLSSKKYFYDLLKKNSINNIPKFNEIHCINDLNRIDYFPVILREDMRWGGKGMIKCKNKNELLEAYKTLNISKNVFVAQYLESKYKQFSNILIRIIVINYRIILTYAVTGNDWNVHTSSGFDKTTFSHVNNDIKKFINHELIKQVIDIIGMGTYGFDCCIHNNKLIFLEANNKLFLAKYQIPLFHNLDSNLYDNFMEDNLRNKIITDALIPTTIPTTIPKNDLLYIPFGFNRIPANTLKKMNIKYENVLLDFITTKPKELIKLLKSNSFDDFMNKNNLYIDDDEIKFEKLQRGYLKLKETIKHKNIVLITVSNWKNIYEYHNEQLFKDLYEVNNQLLTIRKGKPYIWYIFNKYLVNHKMINTKFIDLNYVIQENLNEEKNKKNYECKLHDYLNNNILQNITFLNNKKINNNIQINEIYDGYECIHGNNKNTNEIEFTIFLITINGHQCKYAIESINKLPTDINIKVHVIYKNSPTSVAYEQMHIRCTTKYYIQMDEDMYIFSDKWNSFMNDCKDNIKDNVFNYSFRLIDTLDGVGKDSWLYGIKCFKTEIMKDFRYDYGTTSVDRSFNKIALEKGLTYKLSKKIVGTHAKYRDNFEFFIKSGKFISSLLSNSIKISTIDVIRIVKRLYNNGTIVFNAIIDDCIEKFGSNEKNQKFVKKKIEYITTLYNEKPTYSQIKKYQFDTVDTKKITLFKDNSHINIVSDETYYSIYGIIYFILNDFKYEYTQYPRDDFKLIKRIKIYKFGSCRQDIRTFCKNTQYVMYNNIDLCHSTKEIIQYIKYLLFNDNYILKSKHKNALWKQYDENDKNNYEYKLRHSDYVYIEISSIKKITCNEDTEIIYYQLDRAANICKEKGEDIYNSSIFNVTTMSEDELIEDINTITNLLKKPIIIQGHYNCIVRGKHLSQRVVIDNVIKKSIIERKIILKDIFSMYDQNEMLLDYPKDIYHLSNKAYEQLAIKFQSLI